jgi:hypothetical protein
MTGLDSTIDVEFVGGQRDGAVVGMRDFPRQVYAPIITNPHAGRTQPSWVLPPDAPAEVYELVRHDDGMPSVDDRGRRRYKYVGVR